MESGEVGLLGQAVEVIVRNQDIEDVTVPFLKMEVLTRISIRCNEGMRRCLWSIGLKE